MDSSLKPTHERNPMSKRTTPAKAAASKRAAFSRQRQQFSASRTPSGRSYMHSRDKAYLSLWGIGWPPLPEGYRVFG